MATVEQCEAQPSALKSIPKTLNMFDTFKSEEEKDSDEESFHLPMLDCDEDAENSNKETFVDASQYMPNGETLGETEDDILNKYETNCTPDIDPKMEDSILDEIDHLLEKKVDKDVGDKDEQGKQDSPAESKKDVSTEKEDNGSIFKVSKSVDINSTSTVKNNETVKHCSERSDKIILDKGDVVNKDVAKEDSSESEKIFLNDEFNTEDITDNEKLDLGDHILCNTRQLIHKDETDDICQNKESTEIKNQNEVDMQTENEPMCMDDTETSDELKTNTDMNISELNETTLIASDSETTNVKNQGIELLPENERDPELDDTKIPSQDAESKLINDTDVNVESYTESSEKMEIEEVDKVGDEKCLIEENVETQTDKLAECNSCIENNSKEQKDSQINNDKDSEKEPTDCGSDEPSTIDIPPTNESVETEKCENSNDSCKSQNLECEDLLDISIIRDADEDNASAIAENTNDGHTSEKSYNDNDDQDEGSDKAENELDENEIDQEDMSLTIDKDEEMEFEDDGSNLCDQENVISEHTSDSDKDNVEVRDLENHSADIGEAIPKSDLSDIQMDNKENGITEESCQLKDIDADMISGENQESSKENFPKLNGKRSLSQTDNLDSPNKKIKLSDQPKEEENISKRKNIKTKTLLNFEKYMQNKKLENKLTRSDLEQFCLQKICEAIMHKTDVGELHQTIKKQEHIIENLRKDLQQLTKQARDLDIVNKKLMSELRIQNGPKKPLVPLKITRSVGLQVKLNSTTETNIRRKGTVPASPRTPNNNNTTRLRTITSANPTVIRQVAVSPRKVATPTSAPLLSQALQNRQVVTNNTTTTTTTTKRQPIRPKPAEPQKPTNPGVIDLTDEDDKASKGAVGSPMKIITSKIPLSQAKTINIIPAKTVANKMLNSNQSKPIAVGQVKTTGVGGKIGTPTRTVTTLPQGVRLTPTQVKNGSITIPASVVTSTSGTTQFMYVVQPGPVVTSTAGGTQKAVLLNFQPTNGVLTSTLNGSAVSVLPTKTTNTVQLKTVSAPRKHPAPLPSIPRVPVNPSLKPLLPKPHLTIRKTDSGIVLQWRMPYNLDLYEGIASYQLFAYQETKAAPSTDMWRRVGDVKALALPMACTLTQFASKNTYYFSVRPIDVHNRIGAFSDPEEISL